MPEPKAPYVVSHQPLIINRPSPTQESRPRKKVVYIAGAYRSNLGEWHIRENIRAAEAAAVIVWRYGGVAICPHKNTAYFGGLPGTTDETWLEGDLELLSRSDALYAIPNYRESEGAKAEIEFAILHGIPVITIYPELIDYLYDDQLEEPVEEY